MNIYKNLSGISSVTNYEIGETYIIIKFKDGMNYEYNNQTSGYQHVANMKVLAERGIGLNSYIMQNVKDRYSKKFKTS